MPGRYASLVGICRAENNPAFRPLMRLPRQFRDRIPRGQFGGYSEGYVPRNPSPDGDDARGSTLAACGGAPRSVMTCKYPSQAYSRVCPQSLYPCGIRGRGLYVGVYRGSSMLWLGLQIRCPERNIGMDTGIPRCCLYRTTLAVGPSGNSTTNIRMECVGNPKSSLHCSIPP